MPITKSARKALRGNIRRKARNLKKKEAWKRAIKSYRLLAAQNPPEAKRQLQLVYKALDKAARTHVINKRKAARLKSRMATLLGR